MSLKNTRNILSFILCVFITIGGCVFFAGMIADSTLTSQSYLNSRFTSVVNQQGRQLFEKRIAVLESKSGIPSRVFMAMLNNSQVQATAVDKVLSGNMTGSSFEDRVSQVQGLCCEYLDGNSIKYDDKQVYNTAVEAAHIYFDCFEIENYQAFGTFVDDVKISYQKYMSIGVMLVISGGIMLFLLYSNNKKAASRFFSCILSIGITLTLAGCAGLITKLGMSPKLEPQLYAAAVSNVVSGIWVRTIIIGIIVAVLSAGAGGYFLKKELNK